MKCRHAQREPQCQETQSNLYSTVTDSRWGFTLGFRLGGISNANFSIRVGGRSNANFHVFYQHVAGIPNAKFRDGGLSQREDPQRECFRVAV